MLFILRNKTEPKHCPITTLRSEHYSYGQKHLASELFLFCIKLKADGKLKFSFFCSGRRWPSEPAFLCITHKSTCSQSQRSPRTSLILPRWVISNSSPGKERFKNGRGNANLTIPDGKRHEHLTVRAAISRGESCQDAIKNTTGDTRAHVWRWCTSLQYVQARAKQALICAAKQGGKMTERRKEGRFKCRVWHGWRG